MQLDATWAAVAGAATYRIQYSTSSSFTSPTTINGATGTTYSIVPPQVAGQLWYVRVYALSAGGSLVSAASPTASATAGSISPP